jgi:hypothetical protein
MQQRFRDYLQKPLGDQKLTSITRTMIARMRFPSGEGWQGAGDRAQACAGAGVGHLRQGD